MSQADSSNEYSSSEVDGGISLASVTVGIIAAVFFLLVSSYLSNDASWNLPSDRAWVSTSLTGNDLSGNESAVATHEKVQDIQPHNEEAAHFSDALYSADFMNSLTGPT
ncbi:hypothetical protein ACFQ2T_10925 [Methylophilus flavus]|uniref:Uncharacterized protein n=1 Tax=Methylophilus flavus TaxID=640084 RepID=A0ABW3P9Q7_9PROT